MEVKQVKAALDGLEGLEKFLVELLAVHGRSLSAEGLLRLLGPHPARAIPGGAPDLKRLVRTLEDLVRAQFLSRSSRHYLCTPLVMELASRGAWKAGRLEGLLGILKQSVLAYHDVDWSQEYRLLADLRLALFAGDAERVLQVRGTYVEAQGRNSARDPLALVAGTPFEAWFLQSMPPAIAADMAHGLLNDALLQGMPHTEFRHWLLTLPPGTGLREGLRALLWFMEGEVGEGREALSRWQAGPESHLRPVLEGVALVLEGKAAEAPPHFEAALKTLRSTTRKRNVLLPFPGDIFWILALLARNGPGDLASLLGRLERLDALDGYDPRRGMGLALRRAARAQWGDAVPEEPSRYVYSSATDHPMVHALERLAEVWADKQPGLLVLQELLGTLKPLPLGVFRKTLEALEDRLQGQARKPHVLLDLVRPRAEWERTLDALQALGGELPAVPEAPQETRELRLAWRITRQRYSVDLEALEQKRDARGGWGKGKKVSTKRLFEGLSGMTYLTPQDRAVAVCLKRDPYFSNGLVFQQPKAFLALVGHPNVLWDDGTGNGERSVELVRGTVSVKLTEEPGGLRLGVDPPLEHAQTILREEGRSRLRIYPVEEAHQRLKNILGKGVVLPPEAKARVVQTLGALASVVGVQSDLGLDERTALGAGLERVPGDPSLQLALTPEGEGLRVAAFVTPLKDGPQLRPGQGGASLVLEHGGKRVLVARDLASEARRLESLEDATAVLYAEGSVEGLWHLPDPGDCLQLLLDLEPLREQVGLHWPRGQRFQTPVTAGLGSLSLQVRKAGAWFEVDDKVKLDEDRVLELKSLLDLMAGTQGRFMALGEGRYLALTSAFRKRLHELRTFSEGSGAKGLRLDPLAALALEGLEEGLGGFKADEAWRLDRARVHKAMALDPALPTLFQGDLRPYQLEGFRWMARLAEASLGACLADDMGLGKTIQTLALLVARAGRGPALVVAPTSVVGNWIREAARFAPTLRVQRYAEAPDREALLAGLGAGDLVVTTNGLLQLDLERFQTRTWSTLVLDEAQAIKNASTQRSQAAVALQADFRLATTGTPVENHLMELWSLFRFLNPGLLGGEASFRRRFQGPIEKDRDPEALHALRRLVRPFLLRRLKADVLEDLPERTEITLEVELGTEEAAHYEALRQASMASLEKEGKDQAIMVLAALMRLRRACCHPALVSPGLAIGSAKHDVLMDLVEELRENRHRALVFSQFVDHLALVRTRLDQAGIPYQYLDGSTPTKAREKAVADFQAGQGDLFLLSLKAGGTGPNPTGAD